MPTKVDPNRVCENCGGPITPTNKTGICTANPDCRSALQRKWNGGERPGVLTGDPANSPWLLPIVYDLDTGEEIIDDVAIQVAVEGTRKVGLTETERKIVVQRMISGAWSANDIARHCGTILHRLKPIFTELGYEVVPPRKPNGKRNAAAAELRKIKEPQEARNG